MSRNRLDGSPDRGAPQAEDAPVVVFEDVGKRWAHGQTVVSGVSFSLAQGSFHFLTGASGSGKSTVLRLIALFERPSAGRIRLFGRSIANLAAFERARLRRRLGVIFQEPGLQEHLSAFDNVALAPRAIGRKAADYRSEVAELLAWVGLGSRMDARPHALSAGEKQRLALARAVINRPDLILADEPTGSVDGALALRLLRLFGDLNKVGATVLIASHDEDLVARSGRPRLHLSDGRLTVFPAASREPAP